ncbi:hypothetical protein ACKWTF_016027 [Chironomus riparius]
MSDEIHEHDAKLKIDAINQPQRSAPNILNNSNSIKIDDKYILKLEKNVKNVSKVRKSTCKLLQFSSEWSFEEVLKRIDELDHIEYPQLFIFVIAATNYSLIKDKIEQLKASLLKFGSTRPLLVQLTSENENFTIFYYKEESSSFLLASYPTFWTTSEKFTNFPQFLNLFLNGFIDGADLKVLAAQDVILDRSIILRFLWALNFPVGFFQSIIFNVVKKSTFAEFLAALDAPFENAGSFLSNTAQQYICNVVEDDEDLTKDESIILTAIKCENYHVVDYLINYWTHLIQQLPFNHQIKVVTTAFETNQFDVLCDLLDYADYPFPTNFNVNSVIHKGFKSIIAERESLADAIKDDKMHKIEEFINDNSYSKVGYNINNKSALKQSAEASNFKIFNFLKSKEFYSANPNENFREAEKDAKKYTAQHRKLNVNEALLDDQKTINSLCNRSLIHNKRINKQQENEYRKKIRSWFEDISKIKNGREFLNAAASCTKLKIIFDFENKTVENVSLEGNNALGSTFPFFKWIFIGAKLLEKECGTIKQRDRTIKGVLAHELCHYVMRLVYENQENPYHKNRQDMKEMFEDISQAINKWPSKNSKDPDDECNGIISSVFGLYDANDFHP